MVTTSLAGQQTYSNSGKATLKTGRLYINQFQTLLNYTKINRKYKARIMIFGKYTCLLFNHFRYTDDTRLPWGISESRAEYFHYNLVYKETYARGSQSPQIAIRLSRYKLVDRGSCLTGRQPPWCIPQSTPPPIIASCIVESKYYVSGITLVCATTRIAPILIYYVYHYRRQYTRVFEPVLINTTRGMLLIFDDHG